MKLHNFELHDGGFCFLTGRAGTGKTTILKTLIENGERVLLSASTGVAAMNLNTITINSLLGFFDTDSLRYKFIKGRLNTSLKEVLKVADFLAIDEGSMTSGEQLEIIVEAIDDINSQKTSKRKLGLIICGDMAQLPAIRSKQPYEASCWQERFEPNTIKLTKIWRQNDAKFIDFINSVRCGNGDIACDILTSEFSYKFSSTLDSSFEGTTILATNKEVDRLNFIRLNQLQGKPFILKSTKKGIKLAEWERIVDKEMFKIGAYVMILANKYSEGYGLDREIIYSNGSTGWIEGYGRNAKGKECIYVRLVDGDRVVDVEQITRFNKSNDPAYYRGQELIEDGDSYTVGWDADVEKMVIGECTFYPLKIAYSSTAHKSQGLSLDRVQLDFTHAFFGSPSMLYVGISRCRELKGLRLVGSYDIFVKRCKIDEKVRRFL